MTRVCVLTVASVLGLLAAGCSDHHNHDNSLAVLTVDPPTAELLIVNGAPAMQDYTATITYPDGSAMDVTADTKFAIDPTFGLFDQATLAMGAAGKTLVNAYWMEQTGQAQVLARVKDVRVDPTLPANTPDLFGAPEDPTRAPTIRYPELGAVMPRNVGDFEIHWIDGSSNNVFEISLQTDFADVRAYVPGGNGNAAAGPDASWSAFTPDEWESAVGLESSVQFQVKGVDSTNPVAVGSTQPQVVVLSNETMVGGIYYWSSQDTTGTYPEGIYRHDMSEPGQPAQQFVTTTSAGRCVACHALSRDGKKMAVTWDGGNGQATIIDVATTTQQPTTNNWNFATFTPDGSQLVTVEGGNMVVRDANTQAQLATMTAAGYVSQPDISADGTMMTYVHAPGGPDYSFGSGQIFMRTYDQSTQTFGPEVSLVADANNNYYPSFSPDGQWILYNSAPSGASYNNANASLWVVKTDGTLPPIQLTNANVALGLTNSWGRWAPFAQTVGADNENIFWITVSSKRDFGVRLYHTNQPQIWMTPFYPDRAAAGMDPSDVLFRLPFQNIESNNHIAQWTTQVVTF